MSSRKLVVVALALAGALSAGVAQARGGDDVQWSVTIGTPIGVPIYSQPAPVYRPPAPVYVAPAYRPHHDHYRDYQQPTRWDHDGDRIPDRYDAIYNPRWDRDGDGIPNRHDRYDNLRHDRDGDGIPNWQDRYDGRPGSWHR